MFGAERDLGTVEEGKLADLTIVDGDPFTDFDDLARTSRVLIAGRIHDRAALEAVYSRPSARTVVVDQPHWTAVNELMHRDGCCG